MSDNNNDTVIDLGNSYDAAYPYDSITYSSGIDTITLDPSIYSAIGSLTLPTTSVTSIGNSSNYQISTGTGSTWTTGTSFYPNTNTTVEINADGMKIKEGGDITIGGKSLSEAIGKIEERLGILNPNPALEERWDKLKELRKQYIEMEKDLLEKEKLMKILKEA
jgi:hypothetical protein